MPSGFGLGDYADRLAALIETAGAPAIVGGISWGGTVVVELHRRRARARSATGLFAAEPAADIASLGSAMAAAARPATLRQQLRLMADTDLRDELGSVAVPTLLLWGELDARSPVGVAHEFSRAIPTARLVVLEGTGHLSNLERPAAFSAAVRELCLALPPL